MTTIVKAASPAEFLSLVPHLLGFRPVRSLVVIPFAGTRSLGAMRFDLPDDEPDAIDRVASTIIGMVCRVAEADALTTVVYTDGRFADQGGMPHRDLSVALGRRTHACGMRVNDALCVAGDGWGSYLDPECPVAGRPLAELDEGAAEVSSFPDPAGDQTTGATLPDVDLAETERLARALASLQRAVTVLCGPDSGDVDREGAEQPMGGATQEVPDAGAVAPAARVDAASGVDVAASGVGDAASADDDSRRIDPQALAAVCVLDDLPTLFETALAWDVSALEPYDAATIAWCLARPALRDIALVQWCGGLAAGDEALDAQLRWEAGEEYPAHLAMHMWGEGAQPDPDRLSAALELARRVAAAAPRAQRAGALATCAWLAWALGRSTHADLYALEACAIEPEHGLAEIVRSFVHAGHLPDWAFQRPPRSKRKR